MKLIKKYSLSINEFNCCRDDQGDNHYYLKQIKVVGDKIYLQCASCAEYKIFDKKIKQFIQIEDKTEIQRPI